MDYWIVVNRREIEPTDGETFVLDVERAHTYANQSRKLEQPESATFYN